MHNYVVCTQSKPNCMYMDGVELMEGGPRRVDNACAIRSPCRTSCCLLMPCIGAVKQSFVPLWFRMSARYSRPNLTVPSDSLWSIKARSVRDAEVNGNN